jgi:peptidoglycan LD-endopeptidase LytH
MAAGDDSRAPAFHLLSLARGLCHRLLHPGEHRSTPRAVPVRGVHSPVPGHRRLALSFLLAALGLTACEPAESIIEQFRDPPASAHEAYLHALEDAGLLETALGREWSTAAMDALRDGPLISIPYREEGFFLHREPGALGYRFEAQRGQRIAVELVLDDATDARVFTDLFRGSLAGVDAVEPADGSNATDRMASNDDTDSADANDKALRLVASGSSDTSQRMEFNIRRTDEYTLRVQPELLRGGRYRIVISTGPSLAFPVQDRTTHAVRSFFGASRDGGRREHHGVDIFAPRGTPALAAVEGTVRVRTNNLGGNVIWLRDEEGNQSLYYAHLDSQTVRHGQRVQPGDTIGLVGNTGNARTTPPHLHFGVYARGDGPVDPMPFLREAPSPPVAVTADPARYGEWARVSVEGGRFRQSPDIGATILDELDRSTPLRVIAGSGDWFRVRLPDGRTGFVAARLTEAIDQPLRRTAMVGDRAIQAAPDPLGPVLAVLQPGSDVGVLGQFGDFLYVQPESGPAGWIASDELRSFP